MLPLEAHLVFLQKIPLFAVFTLPPHLTGLDTNAGVLKWTQLKVFRPPRQLKS